MDRNYYMSGWNLFCNPPGHISQRFAHRGRKRRFNYRHGIAS